MNADTLAVDENTPLLRLIESFAKRIVALGLQTPTLFFLEAHRPLASLFAQTTVFLQPTLAPFIGRTRLNTLHQILDSPTHIDFLIQRIEIFTANPSHDCPRPSQQDSTALHELKEF